MKTTTTTRRRRALRTQRERLLYVADVILNRPDEWNQGIWSHGQGISNAYVAAQENTCGTAGCMAGHAATVSPMHLVTPSWTDTGAKAFGLNLDAAHELFLESFMGTEPDITRRKRALRMLRWLASLTWHERRKVSPRTIELFDEGRAKDAVRNHALELAR
jgi:hypothetical protein